LKYASRKITGKIESISNISNILKQLWDSHTTNACIDIIDCFAQTSDAKIVRPVVGHKLGLSCVRWQKRAG